MWQSMLIAAPSVGSIRTNAIGDFPRVQFKLHNRKTLLSYRLPENFRSIALYPKSSATRLFGSGSTDPVTGNDKGYVTGDENSDSLLDLLGGPSIKDELDDMEVNLDEELVKRVLESSSVTGENLIDFFNWAAYHKSRILKKRFVDQLIRKVSEDYPTDMKTAYSLWGFLQKKVIVDMVTTEMLNQQISLFSRVRNWLAAYEVFDDFGGCERNADTYYLTIKALCDGWMFDVAGLVCEKMISEDMFPEGEKLGTIICSFCKGGKLKEAYSVYKSAKEIKVDVPPSSLGSLVKLLCAHKNEDDDYVNLAIQILSEAKNISFS